MNIRRMMMASGPLRAALWPARSETSRMCTSVDSSCAAVGQGKENIFVTLRSLMGETLDRIMREEEKKGVSIRASSQGAQT